VCVVVCVCVCVGVCVCVCVNVCMCVCMRIAIEKHIRALTHYTHKHTHVYTYP